MRDTLQELADACHGDHRPDCPILHDLEGGARTTDVTKHAVSRKRGTTGDVVRCHTV
jgi:MerR family copper efflux transcriptional regulator